MSESEHDQLVRLKERVNIFKEWLSSQFNCQYTEWENFENNVLQKVATKFNYIFVLEEVPQNSPVPNKSVTNGESKK